MKTLMILAVVAAATFGLLLALVAGLDNVTAAINNATSHMVK